MKSINLPKIYINFIFLLFLILTGICFFSCDRADLFDKSTNFDPGVIISETGGSTSVSEDGSSDTYKIFLTTEPESNVSVYISADGQLNVNGNPDTTILYNNVCPGADCWSEPKVITITANDDAISEGPHTSTITHTASATDPDYDNIAIKSVSVNIEDNEPVSSVSVTDVTSSDTSSESVYYKIGDNINIDIKFSESVTVDTLGGTPLLILETGAMDENVNYDSGSGTNTLKFIYTVAEGNEATDMDYKSVAALNLNGGTIKDSGSIDVSTNLPAPGSAGSLSASTTFNVDGVRPTVVNVTSASTGQISASGSTIDIQIEFSEDVNITGTPRLELNTDTVSNAEYLSGSNTKNLILRYNTISGNKASNLNYTSESALSLNGGSITDTAGNNANLTLPATGSSDSLSSANIEIIQ